MMENKITPIVDFNQWLKRLGTQLNEPTNQNSIKVVKPMNKTLLYDFMFYWNNRTNAPPPPGTTTQTVKKNKDNCV